MPFCLLCDYSAFRSLFALRAFPFRAYGFSFWVGFSLFALRVFPFWVAGWQAGGLWVVGWWVGGLSFGVAFAGCVCGIIQME